MSYWSEVDTAEFPLPSVRGGFDRAREFSSRVSMNDTATNKRDNRGWFSGREASQLFLMSVDVYP